MTAEEFMCRHDDETGCDKTRKRAIKILSEQFIIDDTVSEGEFIHMAVAHLGRVTIHGDQWFRVTYETENQRHSVQCDWISDGLARIIELVG